MKFEEKFFHKFRKFSDMIRYEGKVRHFLYKFSNTNFLAGKQVRNIYLIIRNIENSPKFVSLRSENN